MAALNKGKHTIAEIDGVRCSIVETGLSEQRLGFLKTILEHNGYTIKTQPDKKAEGAESTYTLGVTDILFNPVVAIYERKLWSPYNLIVTPAYWNQWTEFVDNRYWEFRKR
jgi:hypothetical protein